MLEFPQGSDGWLSQRLGRVTASRIGDLMARTKSGWGASRANYEAELIAERLTGVPGEKLTNAAMQWGTETEPQARAAYAFLHDAEVEEVGFVQHPTIEQSGASPDGLVGKAGLLEIKCPQTATHIATLLGGSVPEKYRLQMQWQMACTGREWCDFASFDPRLPGDMQLWVRRVERDGTLIAEIEREVRAFLAQVEEKIRQLQALREPDAADYMAVG